MARRGGALSDSESDLSEDDDVSDVEDEALRRRVREAATGVRRDARLDHRRFEDRARGSAPSANRKSRGEPPPRRVGCSGPLETLSLKKI